MAPTAVGQHTRDKCYLCSLTFTTAGAKTLTGTYVPGTDPNFAASTSAGVLWTVVAPSVTASPGNYNFGSVTVAGTATGTVTETITNGGAGALIISSLPTITGTNAADFNIASTTCTAGTTVAPAANCSIVITFKPGATGNRTATLTLTDNAANSPQSITLTGRGI